MIRNDLAATSHLVAQRPVPFCPGNHPEGGNYYIDAGTFERHATFRARRPLPKARHTGFRVDKTWKRKEGKRIGVTWPTMVPAGKRFQAPCFSLALWN